MAKLLTIGETMVSFNPNTSGLLRYARDFYVRTAGAESNVASGVQKLGHSSAWVSKIGDDEMGKYVLNHIRSEGVDCSNVIIDNKHRTGIMMKQLTGGETSVFYYRENSAASHLKPEMFENTEILHLTGITPVLSQSCSDMVDKAIKMAKANNSKFSFDPNIRKKLWLDTDYTQKIRELTLLADIVLIGLDEAKILFDTDDVDSTVEVILKANPNCQMAVKNGAKGAYVANKTEKHFIPPVPCHFVEPVGAGDAFAAGFLAGVLSGESLEICGKMGAIAGALTTEAPSDVEGQPDSVRMNEVLNKIDIVYR